jgi:hypothetical protein
MLLRRLRYALARRARLREEGEFFAEWDRQGWDTPPLDRLCPRCEQGTIKTMRVRSTGEVVRVCNECDATWGHPSSNTFEDLTSYLRERGLAGSWDQLTDAS